MRWQLRKGFAAIAAIAISVTLLAVSLTTPVISTSADFSIFNTGWNGTSDLAVTTFVVGKFSPTFELRTFGTEVTIEQISLTKLDLSPAEDALVIIGPSKKFSGSEGDYVGDFVRAGGVLLLADDFGSANSLLEGMNATSRFSRDLVMDLAFEKQPEFSVCFDIRPDGTTTNVSTLLLNYPSSLAVNTSTTQVIARSSIASWMDTNQNHLQDWGEPRGPFPLIAREGMGMGSIYLLSDPSVLINGMAKELDNGVFTANLMAYLSEGRTSVMFDESHRDFFDPVSVTLRFAGGISPNVKGALVVVSLVLTLWVCTDLIDRSVAWTIRKGRWAVSTVAGMILPSSWLAKKAPRPEPVGEEVLVETLSKKHPEWRQGLMRYVIRQKVRHSKVLAKEPLGDH